MRSESVLLLAFVCCGWPLIVYIGINWLLGYSKRVDWKNINLPWRKDDD
jgi:hypothetical protein